jgi:DNA-binding MarR family transcriptional regulator
MDAIPFGLKRASLVLQHRLVGKLLRPCALTPARFDLMFLLRKHVLMRQKDLRRMLDVARSTVSRMLRSLEEIGYVVRSRYFARGGTRSVRLSELGRRVLRHAVRCIMRRKLVRRPLDRILRFMDRWDLDAYCGWIRVAFGDPLLYLYPWHPDS